MVNTESREEGRLQQFRDCDKAKERQVKKDSILYLLAI